MNFMSTFFLKKYNQDYSSVVNNMQYNLFTNFPLSDALQSLGLFLLIHHVFPILSVILTKYHYIILTDYRGIQFHRYIS